MLSKNVLKRIGLKKYLKSNVVGPQTSLVYYCDMIREREPGA